MSMSDFQKAFFAKGVENRLFTQDEFDAELQAAQAEIVAMAVTATREAVRIERDACIKIATDAGHPELGELMRNRVQEKVE